MNIQATRTNRGAVRFTRTRNNFQTSILNRRMRPDGRLTEQGNRRLATLERIDHITINYTLMSDFFELVLQQTLTIRRDLKSLIALSIMINVAYWALVMDLRLTHQVDELGRMARKIAMDLARWSAQERSITASILLLAYQYTRSDLSTSVVEEQRDRIDRNLDRLMVGMDRTGVCVDHLRNQIHRWDTELASGNSTVARVYTMMQDSISQYLEDPIAFFRYLFERETENL